MDVKTSQRAFVGVTLTTLLGIALVLVVYAYTLGTLTGGNVVVGGFGGAVYYSTTNVNTLPEWTTALDVPNTSTLWYAKMNTTAGGYSGTVSISWQLYRTTDGGSSWSPVGSATTTSFTLDGTAQNIYATADGTFQEPGNRDWSATATSSATYRIEVTVSSV